MFSVVVPLYNEETNVLRLLEAVPASLETNPYVDDWELICVDDGSTDRTAERLAGAASERVVVVTLPVNQGQSAAILHGVARARGDVIGVLDGDLQTTPDDFTVLLAEMQRGSWDAVHGIRRDRRDSLVRRWSSRVANAVRRWALKDDFEDISCPLAVFRRTCMDGVPRFDALHRYLPYLFRLQGLRVTQVPVRHFPRVADQAKYGIANRLAIGVTSLLVMRWLGRHAVMRGPEDDQARRMERVNT